MSAHKEQPKRTAANGEIRGRKATGDSRPGQSATQFVGTAALELLYGGQALRDARGILLCDIDDVFCLGRPYGSAELFFSDAERPPDLYERLWHQPAVQVLIEVMHDYGPRVVLTTSWLRLMDRPQFDELFRATGLGVVADALHEKWEAPTRPGWTRHTAIENWLTQHYRLEPLVILDDELSGTGLRGSALDRSGSVVLCEANVGLHAGHLPLIRRALGRGRDEPARSKE